MEELSRIFRAIENGEAIDTSDLLAHVYDELRRMAGAMMAKESAGQTLQATALVHEAFLRLTYSMQDDTPADVENADNDTAEQSPTWKGRGHFFSAAAESMRRILIDAARKRNRLKRGGDRLRVDLEPGELVINAPPDELLALEEALQRLEEEDSTKAEVVKLRYFAGLSIEETAEALEISTASVKRYWAYSKAWLRREMDRDSKTR